MRLRGSAAAGGAESGGRRAGLLRNGRQFQPEMRRGSTNRLASELIRCVSHQAFNNLGVIYKVK